MGTVLETTEIQNSSCKIRNSVCHSLNLYLNWVERWNGFRLGKRSEELLILRPVLEGDGRSRGSPLRSSRRRRLGQRAVTRGRPTLRPFPGDTHHASLSLSSAEVTGGGGEPPIN